jgi:hypothetical protein
MVGLPQTVFLKNLFTIGSFGSVSLGMNERQIKMFLGKPTQADYHDREDFVGFYGNIKFLFVKDTLAAIEWNADLCTYNPNCPIAGEIITLDPSKLI